MAVICAAKVEEASVSIAAREVSEALVGLLGQRVEKLDLLGYGVENTY
jgi:hypothetical protein